MLMQIMQFMEEGELRGEQVKGKDFILHRNFMISFLILTQGHVFINFTERGRNNYVRKKHRLDGTHNPRCPDQGIEPATFWYTGRCSNHLEQDDVPEPPGQCKTSFYLRQIHLELLLENNEYTFTQTQLQPSPVAFTLTA